MNAVHKQSDIVAGEGFGVEVGAAPEFVGGLEVFGVAAHVVDHDKKADGVDPVTVLGGAYSSDLRKGGLKHFGSWQPVFVEHFPIRLFGLKFVEQELDLPALDAMVRVAEEDVVGDLKKHLFGVGDLLEHRLFFGVVGAGDGGVEGGAVEFALASEMVVDEREVDTGFGRDFSDGNGGVTEVGKEPPGGVDESLFGIGLGKSRGSVVDGSHKT